MKNETTLESKYEGMSALQKANAVRKEMKEAGTKPKALNPIEKSEANPKSLRLAINAKCYWCECEDADPAVQWRIGNCLVMSCPLRPLRPYQHMEGTDTPKALL